MSTALIIDPNPERGENLRRMRVAIPAAQPARIERWIEALRKAGIPE